MDWQMVLCDAFYAILSLLNLDSCARPDYLLEVGIMLRLTLAAGRTE